MPADPYIYVYMGFASGRASGAPLLSRHRDPIGYAFGSATMAFLVLQKLARAFCIRLRRTYNS
jgi:hypothetical protein